MVWLILGVVLWAGVHFVPTLFKPAKQWLVAHMGEAGYRAIFSAVVVLSVALMVIGWRSASEVHLYQPVAWSGPVGFVLMICAFVLFGAAKHDTAIKRLFRHPQLTSILVWAASHLLGNGTVRAWVLFGGLGAWALLEMPLISARDGAWTPPAAPGWRAELKGLLISAVIFLVALALHPWFAGVAPISR